MFMHISHAYVCLYVSEINDDMIPGIRGRNYNYFVIISYSYDLWRGIVLLEGTWIVLNVYFKSWANSQNRGEKQHNCFAKKREKIE